MLLPNTTKKLYKLLLLKILITIYKNHERLNFKIILSLYANNEHLKWFCSSILNKESRNMLKEVIKAVDNDMHHLKKKKRRIMLYFLCSDFKETDMWIKKKVNDIQKKLLDKDTHENFSGIR